ncbi:MAG TPA: hypothetical protein VEF71_07695 [Streptosporangiaceae bacterium]|nr:hypothetical protein [Streptosporangiaceae bacterium]
MLELGVEADVRAGERLADRAAELRVLGRLGELGIVEALDLTADGELDAARRARWPPTWRYASGTARAARACRVAATRAASHPTAGPGSRNAACLIADVASLLRGRRYVHEEHGLPASAPAVGP